MLVLFVFFFNDTATTEIYTLSLHDALPICDSVPPLSRSRASELDAAGDRLQLLEPLPHRGQLDPHADSVLGCRPRGDLERSEEHTSELQSRQYLVCRLLLEKKKTLTLSYAH